LSETENPEMLRAGDRITVEDIRALSGASTPHFALQLRARVLRLIEGLPEDDPARIEGERKAASLAALADHSGEPRSGTGAH
jgi:hypothetical protein